MNKKRLFISVLILGLSLVLVAGLTARLPLLPAGSVGVHDKALAQELAPGAARPRAVTAAPPDTYTGDHVVIHYYDSALHPSEPLTTCISSAQAQLLADQLDETWEAYEDYGFNAPSTGGATRLPVWVFSPLDLDAWGWARGDHIEVDPVRVQANAADMHKGTPHHELFHQVQYTYGNGEPGWVVEGTAKFIEDMVFSDLDAHPDSAFVSRANIYLGNPNRTLWDKVANAAAPGGLLDVDYNATLLWKYLTEQYGDTGDPYFGAEPQYGIDWLVDFWERVDTHDGINAVNAALPAGVYFEQAFEGFLVTNYLKRLNVDAAYRYVDDPGPAFALDRVRVEYGTESLPLSHTGERVEDWGAIYYVGDPPGACPFIQVTLDGDPGSQAFYAVLATRGSDTFYHDHAGFQAVANDLTKTFYNDGYDRVVAVVGGLHNPAEYDVSMSCVSPALNIVEPRQDLFAEVGDPDQPRRMMVLAEVTGGGSSFVEGLSWEDFQVSIGGKPVDDVVTGAYVQSQYWLIVQPPTQTVSGDPPWPFDLDVTLEGLSDHEDDAVHYRPLPHYDEVLVLDTSGSMDSPSGYPKLLAAQNAANLYVDELADDDKMGAVQFQTTATPVWNGMATVGDISRGLAHMLINDLSADGCTSIGGGLVEALDQYDDAGSPGDPDNPDVIILLSDGMENTPPCWEYGTEVCSSNSCAAGPYVRDQVMDADTIVHTVALGPGSHEDLMERIAQDTGGRYRFATLPGTLATTQVAEPPAAPGLAPPLGARSLAAPQQNEWAYQLSGIYDFFEGEVEGRERLRVREATIPSENPSYWDETTIYLDQTVSHATFSIAYEQETILNGDCGQLARFVELRAPDDTPDTSPSYSTNYHDVFEVSSPMPGNWRVRVQIYQTGPCLMETGPTGVQAQTAAPYNFQVMVSAQTGLATEVRVGTPHEERFIGLCVPIFATFLGSSGLVESGWMTATVTTPTGGQVPISLSDDGNQGDGAPDDGIYGGLFCRGSEPGSYTVEVQGRVEAMAGTIRRLATASFYVQDDDDDDGDGLPNLWEQLHGLNPSVADDTGNPDLDFGCIIGCGAWTNAGELAYGTDPHNDDTDGGGEMDYSELLFGQDPSGGPEDDGVDIPTSFRVTPGNGHNVVTYDARTGDDTYWLFWSTDSAMADLLADGHRLVIGATGIYTHTSLSNGTTYYYLLVALRDGHISGFADQASASPAVDPTPPEGNVLINGDAPQAFALEVTLSLYASDDTTEMLIANTPDFAGATWEPFASTRAWRIAPGSGTAAFVYVRFRDGTGNVSDIAVDGILAPRTLYLPLILCNVGGS